MKILKKNIFNDILLNIVASIILTIATQIVALPILSRLVSIDSYGNILTMYAIMSIFAIPFGGTLCDSRLLMRNNTLDKKIEPNFNYLVCVLLIINFLLTCILNIYFFNISIFYCFLMSFSSSFLLLRAYYIVEYRITLDFVKILIVSIFSLIGYTIGIFLSYLLNIWVLTFFIGELIPTLFILLTSKSLKYGFKKDEYYIKAFDSFKFLVVATFLGFLIMYADRFFLNPLLGPKYVSIFLVSTFLGKTIGIILGPISAVLFSYYVKEDKVTIKTYFKRVLIYFMITMLSFLFIIVIGKPLLKMLYPTIYPHMLDYYFVGNFGAILFILGNLLQTNLLANASARMNTLVQLIYFIIYILLGYFLTISYGLFGFSISIILSNSFRVILIILITHLSIKKNIESFKV